MAIFANMALGQDAAEGTGFPSDATLAAKLKEVSDAPAVAPVPVKAPAGATTQTTPTTSSEKPRVTFTDEPALEPGPEMHIGTGSVAWNSMLKKSEAERALQEAREKRNIYRNIAAGGSPIVKPRTASEFLAANPPTPVPVSDVVQNRANNLLEVRASGASQFNRAPQGGNRAPQSGGDVPQFSNPQVGQAPRKSRPKFFSFLKPKSQVEARPEDFQNPYNLEPEPALSPTAAYPQGPEPVTEGQRPPAMDNDSIDALIAEAAAGSSVAQQAPPVPQQPSRNSNGGGFLKKLFGKKPVHQPVTISDPFPSAPPLPGGLPQGELPPVPTETSDEFNLDIPAPPSSVNAPEAGAGNPAPALPVR